MDGNRGRAGSGATGWMLSTVMLALAIGLAVLGAVFGIAAVLSIVFPGPSGEWAGIGAFAAWVVDLPIGLLALIVGLTSRSGPRAMRRWCVLLSILVLLLPVAAQVIWSNHLF